MTPDDLKALVALLVAPFDTVPRDQFDEDALHEAATKLPIEERDALFNQTRIMLVIASKVRAAIGDRETDLFGAAADRVTLMNLLCAVDEDLLSIDVLDRLCAEMEHFFGGWTALPPNLFHAMARRARAREEIDQLEAEEAEQAANDQTKH